MGLGASLIDQLPTATPSILMASAVVEGRPAILIPQRRFAQFLGDGAGPTGGFARKQRNDFMLGLVHEAVHLRNPDVPSPAVATHEQRLAEELRAWRAVSLNVVRPLRRLGEPMHSTFLRVDDAFLACGDRAVCQPLTSARDPVAGALDAVTRVTNNGSIVRKVIALALSLAVQATALSAPLVHAHPDDHATEHHAGRAVHTHWDGHAQSHQSSEGPAVATADHDRAVFLNAFVAVTASALPAFGVTHALFELPVPAERAPYRPIEVVRSHDPPLLRSLSSRAPPAILS